MASATYRLLATLLMAACAAACSTPKRPAPDTYVDRVEARAVAALEQKSFVLRHNPATACGCPPFEVRLGEHWQRVEIGGELDDPTIVALLKVAGVGDELGQGSNGQPLLGLERSARVRDHRMFEVEGALSDEVALCGRGGLYVSLVPTAFVGVVATAP
jgi:hypothetical protein